MSDQRDGGIAWTDQTWNPVRGCSLVSPGCTNCYAMGVAARFSGPGQPYEGLAKRVNGRGVWTGEVRLVPEHLADPLRWTRPRRVFVNSMSDLFHERLTNEQIAAVFGVMAASPRHTFQVLTKRPQQAVEWFYWLDSEGGSPLRVCLQAARDALYGIELKDGLRSSAEWRALDRLDGCAQDASADTPWPLPNAWIGASAEDQQRLDERVPRLLQIPAAVRFLSLEPLLGPLDLTRVVHEGVCAIDVLRGLHGWPIPHVDCAHVDWVIVGGESGRRARQCDVAWIRSIVEQCRKAGVACFVKQLGADIRTTNDDNFSVDADDYFPPPWPEHIFAEDRVEHDLNGTIDGYQGAPVRIHLRHPKGGDPTEWPADLRVQQWPESGR